MDKYKILLVDIKSDYPYILTVNKSQLALLNWLCNVSTFENIIEYHFLEGEATDLSEAVY